MTLLVRVSCYVLIAAAVFVTAWALASVPVSPAPRLGPRGAERHKALESNGLFAAIEPLLRFIAGLLSRLPLGSFRAKQDLELRRAGNFLGLTADEYSALSLVS